MKFRRKPVIVEAVQWFNHGDHPDVFAHPNKEFHRQGWGIIYTREGMDEVAPGDWIVTDAKGDKRFCKPDVFEMTYEPVGEQHES